MISQRSYEVIRWLIAVFLPAFGVLFSTLAEAWSWDVPVKAILTTLSAVELFLGAIFGISKIVYDSQENAGKDLK